MEAEHNLELQSELSINISIYLNNSNPGWNYNPVKGINLVHNHDRIYVPKTFRKCVLKCYHCYLQHSDGDRLPQTLNTASRCLVIFDQSQKLFRTCKDCHKFKISNSKYGLLPAKAHETLTPWHAVYVDLIVICTILDKVIQPYNKIITRQLQLLCMTFIEPATVWFQIEEIPIIDQPYPTFS